MRSVLCVVTVPFCSKSHPLCFFQPACREKRIHWCDSSCVHTAIVCPKLWSMRRKQFKRNGLFGSGLLSGWWVSREMQSHHIAIGRTMFRLWFFFPLEMSLAVIYSHYWLTCHWWFVVHSLSPARLLLNRAFNWWPLLYAILFLFPSFTGQKHCYGFNKIFVFSWYLGSATAGLPLLRKCACNFVLILVHLPRAGQR